VKYKIVDCSSESKEHAVSNIKTSRGRWETDGEASKALLDLKFDSPVQIGLVQVELVGASFIELLVRNEGDKDYQVLMSIRMVRSFQNCKTSQNKPITYSFDCSQFTKSCLVKKWSLMRIYLTQPWCEIPIGLAQLTVYPYDDMPDDYEVNMSNNNQKVEFMEEAKGEMSDSATEEMEFDKSLSSAATTPNTSPKKPSSTISFKQIKEISNKTEDAELFDLSKAIKSRNSNVLTNIPKSDRKYALREKLCALIQIKDEDESTESMEEDEIKKILT